MPPSELKTKASKLQKRIDSRRRQGLVLILAGILFISFSFYWRHLRARILSFDNYTPEETKNEGVSAANIKIPSVGIDLPVEKGQIVKGVWQISEKGASQLDKSANPGHKGNTVIYGHNKNSLFGPIRWLKEGDSIEITDENRTLYTYRVVKTVITTPDDIEYVLPKSEEILTLYTCTGLLDSKRHIVLAKREN